MTYVAISKCVRRILEESPITKGVRSVTINNFVNDEDFYLMHGRDGIRKELGLPLRKFIIGYLPSFNSHVKGHAELVMALNCLYEYYPHLSVVLALLSNDENIKFEVPYNVIQLKQTNDMKKLRKFYNSVDIVMIPSLEETFSNTAIESLACGTPVLGFKTGIMAEVLTNRHFGAAVMVGDYEKLAEEIFRMQLKSIDRQRCSAFALERFSKRSIMNQFLKLYSDLKRSDNVQVHMTADEFAIFDYKIDDLINRRKASMSIARLRHERNRKYIPKQG